MIQGMGGLMSLTGTPDSQGGEPVKVGVAFVDIFTGLYAANAIMAALFQRERTGQGAYIDLALLDVQVGVLANQALNYLTSGTVPERLGNAHPNIVPYQAFATQDGHLILAVGNDAQFKRFCDVAGRPELGYDPAYLTNALRVAHREELIPQIVELVKQKTTNEWLAVLESVGVPCGPINTLDRVFADPQVQHRGLTLHYPHPLVDEVKLVSNPIRFEGEALNSPNPPPLLGEHTESVLTQLLNLDAKQQADLKTKGII
jgi:crotonobetainyl-CoA:carnitine CoA-transferase CaiB-like acyl-CoA transferase